jgi:hypothetical protein
MVTPAINCLDATRQRESRHLKLMIGAIYSIANKRHLKMLLLSY